MIRRSNLGDAVLATSANTSCAKKWRSALWCPVMVLVVLFYTMRHHAAWLLKGTPGHLVRLAMKHNGIAGHSPLNPVKLFQAHPGWS